MDVLEMSKRAKRIAAVGQIVETYDCPDERFHLIRRLAGQNIISQFAAEILAEEYAPEMLR